MNGEQAGRALLATLRREIDASVDSALQVINTGRGRKIRDPFSGQTKALPADPRFSALHGDLAKAGLVGKPAFVAILREALVEVATRPMFGLLTAFDGEGCFEMDAPIQLTLPSGERLPTHLHELFASRVDKGPKA